MYYYLNHYVGSLGCFQYQVLFKLLFSFGSWSVGWVLSFLPLPATDVTDQGAGGCCWLRALSAQCQQTPVCWPERTSLPPGPCLSAEEGIRAWMATRKAGFQSWLRECAAVWPWACVRTSLTPSALPGENGQFVCGPSNLAAP